MGSEIGDKVRLKSSRGDCARGLITKISNGSISVSLVGTEKTVEVNMDEITNLSLAARKAWQSMPNRRVGRPKGTRLCDRVSVTLRIDRELWDQFRRLEADGTIEDRTATINTWISEKIGEVADNGK